MILLIVKKSQKLLALLLVTTSIFEGSFPLSLLRKCLMLQVLFYCLCVMVPLNNRCTRRMN